MAEDFKRLERTLVRKGKIIDYYQDTVQVPNGNVVKWDFIGHKGAAAMLAVREDGKLLMVRQWRNALDRYTLEIPAGGKNSIDEPTETAAVRELEEETGYIAGKVQFLLSIYTTVAFCNEKIDIYLVRDLKRQEGQHLDEDEFIDVEACELEELVQMIYDGKIEDSKTVGAVMTYKSLLMDKKL
ncbi:MAG: NUDIX hydrolase [Lachnospiraceae bacterium]|nr:NUDIX hydrolase [Lachnospiraceae bacterium]